MERTLSTDTLLLAFGVGLVFTGILFISTMESNEKELKQITSQAQFNEVMNSDSSQGLLGNPGEALDSTAQFSRSSGGSGGSSEVRRSSNTNIQVNGIDEPDILKNSGEEIFYSSETYFNGNTSVFNTLPVEDFEEKDRIPMSGELFLTNDTAIVLGQNITAFDREDYEKEWNKELNSSIESARMINDSIYLLTRDYRNNCPVRPLSSLSMPCTGFYYSDNADTTYTAMKMDSASGEVTDSTGFLGDGPNTEVYISKNSIYLTYTEEASDLEMLLEFIDDEGESVLDQETLDRIEELRSYDISENSLRNEIHGELQEYFSSGKSEEEFEEAISSYVSERKRELSTTGIAEFSTSNLELINEGEVPGSVNDQFSMSEKNGEFRIATTVGDSWQFDVEPENDLYVLDEELEIKGEVTGIGLNETIYSVRYMDDKAYVVTFRRIDPFHIVDLSDSENPEVVGELKLPGFSSYLHPLSEDRILGIGEENNSVKAVIFDVKDDDPTVEDSLILEDYYSEISSSHHAFQIDTENEVFFLPGSEGGHFFNYSDGLEHVHEVEMRNVKRGAFVNQNFYVFNDYNASVVDMNEWETVKEIEFREENHRPIPLPGPVPRPFE